MPSVSTPWTLTQDCLAGQRGEHVVDCAPSAHKPELIFAAGQRGEHVVDCAPSAHKPKVFKHRDYFFVDGNVLLQVEDVQYKLHRSLLGKHSPVFEELFTIPQPAGSTEGCSEENPIVLSGIQAANFTRFLSLLYPPTLGLCDIATVDEWTSVMDQADRWQVDSLREHAISQLRGLYIEPVRKIIIWQRYNLPADELVPSYMDVISRPQSLSQTEAHDLGLSHFVTIAQARDAVHSRGACRCCAGSKAQLVTSVGRDRILEDIVRTVIGITRSPSARY